MFASFVSEHSQTPNKLIQFRRPIPAVSQPLLKNELWFVRSGTLIEGHKFTSFRNWLFHATLFK